jgi:DNA-binding transcriptional ArsR family regulator
MKVQVDALQARILAILKDWYPITVEELRDELSLPRGVLERSLRALMVKGVIALEPLSDKTYIRLLVPEIMIDVERTGVRRRRKSRPKPEAVDGDSIMYR